jgi:hypothetical protein
MNPLTKTLVLALILCFSAQDLVGGAEGDTGSPRHDIRHGVAASLGVLGDLLSGAFQVVNISGIDMRVTAPGDRVLARFRYESGLLRTNASATRPVFRMTGEGKFLTIESPFLKVTVVRSGRDSK